MIIVQRMGVQILSLAEVEYKEEPKGILGLQLAAEAQGGGEDREGGRQFIVIMPSIMAGGKVEPSLND